MNIEAYWHPVQSAAVAGQYVAVSQTSTKGLKRAELIYLVDSVPIAPEMEDCLMNDDDLMKVKVCFIGDAGVGKTSLIKRFVLDVFDDRYIATIGTKVTKKIVEVDDGGNQVRVMMLVWDIMGQKGFRELLREAYFFGAHGAIAVCDLTNKETLEELRYWIKALTDVAGDVPMVFAGNKADLQNESVVKEAELKDLADKYGAEAFLTSAKTGQNVEDVFKALGAAMAAKLNSQ
jgi:small GTP-binding protein